MMKHSANHISMYHLDGSLLQQKNLLNIYPHNIIDCHDIHSKNLYCDDQAFHQIYERYMSSTWAPVTFIGSGNFHYVTYIHLMSIKNPFTLILFDHHTDLMENDYLLTCGSWVTHALRNLPHIKKAIIIGPNPNTFDKIPLDLQDRVAIFPDNWNSQKLINHIYYECETEDIYISIDKDVLDETYSKTNWDHGYMDLDVLIECLTTLEKSTNLLQVDICGEWLVSQENSYTPLNQAYIKRNERTNIALIHALIHPATKPQHPTQQAYRLGS